MKANLLLVAVISVVVGSAIFLIVSSTNPEELIVGEWQEVSWEYEKPIAPILGDSSKAIADDLKNRLAQDMIIHMAESWKFSPDGSVKLIGQGKDTVVVNWKFKGRGHILKLHYEDGLEEYYNVVELNRDELILHFHVEMQAKGIAKITFKRLG